MLEFKYHVETGPDGIRWVSIEPLMTDIVSSIDALMKIDHTDMKDDDKHILDMKILGLRTIHEFLGSIITADNLKKMKDKTNGQSQQEETSTILH